MGAVNDRHRVGVRSVKKNELLRSEGQSVLLFSETTVRGNVNCEKHRPCNHIFIGKKISA